MRSQTTKYGGFWICGGERCVTRAWEFYNDRMAGAKMIDPRIKRINKKCGEVA